MNFVIIKTVNRVKVVFWYVRVGHRQASKHVTVGCSPLPSHYKRAHVLPFAEESWTRHVVARLPSCHCHQTARFLRDSCLFDCVFIWSALSISASSSLRTGKQHSTETALLEVLACGWWQANDSSDRPWPAVLQPSILRATRLYCSGAQRLAGSIRPVSK